MSSNDHNPNDKNTGDHKIEDTLDKNTLLDENPTANVEGFKDLVDLASNLRWSWTHLTDDIWSQIDPDIWKYTNNPWVMLQTVSRQKVKQVLSDENFRKRLDYVLAEKKQHDEADKWFHKNHDKSPLKSIVYFCMEYMLSESLPIYSGGLGNVAGDQLKAASDLGVPVTAIGLLYQQGYFRQVIDKEGQQLAFYPSNNSWQLPTIPVRNTEGEWLRIKIDLTCLPIWLRVWKVQVGCADLYLLDSNDAANFPPFRGITSELYGGDTTTRLMQEIILGIGGWKLVETLGLIPQVCHLNEGHAAFAVLERARSYMKSNNIGFKEALTITRAGNLFTTHTAVKAGFDYFPPELIKQYLGEYAEKHLGISIDELLSYGRIDADNSQEFFNMANLAIRCSGSVNAVSVLHARVSRHLFNPAFKRWPTAEVPVAAVTNGIHVPSWESAPAFKLWADACGKDRWGGETEHLENQINKVTNEALWNLRNSARANLIKFARERLTLQHSIAGESYSTIRDAKNLFNENILTIGFARRFATYKRPTLLLHNPERFKNIFTNSEKPVQLIIAGKAHPADKPGQALIEQWKDFIDQHNMHDHVIFLSDYDILVTEQLIHGVDVWLNNPRRPWEACGTSGMKVLVNGGINLSELDGWWAEAYNPDVGFAIGDGEEHGSDPEWDNKDAEQLYTVLETKVIPEFYSRDANQIPEAWVSRMRKSMARLTPHYSANRAVRDYVEKHYLPAATLFVDRSLNKDSKVPELVKWREELDENWGSVKFEDYKADTKGGEHHFTAKVNFGNLNPEFARVQMFANKINPDDSDVMIEMKPENNKKEKQTVFTATAPNDRTLENFTARVIPFHDAALVPMEAQHILWQK